MYLEVIKQAIKEITTLSGKVVEASDAEKYANSVQKLNSSVDKTYEKMREIILEDKNLSTDEKLERLDKIAKSQSEAMQTCDEAIKGNRENVSKIVGTVLLALATCGISCIPKLTKERKRKKVKAIDAKEDEAKIEENPVKRIE